jgi:hypothetical protein
MNRMDDSMMAEDDTHLAPVIKRGLVPLSDQTNLSHEMTKEEYGVKREFLCWRQMPAAHDDNQEESHEDMGHLVNQVSDTF